MIDSNDDIFERKRKFIAMAHERLDQLLSDLSEDLKEKIINDFADRLDKTNGNVDASSANINLIRSIDKIYSKFVKEKLQELVQQIGEGAMTINSLNADYFGHYDSDLRKYKSTVQKIQRIIRDRLGITTDKNGKSLLLKEGGFLDSLLKDVTIKNQIKNLSYQEVLRGSGFQNFKQKLSQMIAGDKENLGGFQQYYRQYAYDIYVKIDRTESKMYAQDLNLVDFYYEGTLIETSRVFCVNHAGKLFNIKDTKRWKDLIGKYRVEPGKRPGTTKKVFIGPIVPDKKTYKPLDDMGGIGCRHIPRFISPEVADKIRALQNINPDKK